MKSIVREYIDIKWTLSVLFSGNNYIIVASKKNEIFESQFFSLDILKKVKEILTSNPSTLDSEKIKNLRSSMLYYVSKGKDIDIERLKLIREIIEISEHPKVKNIDKYYKEQYRVRNQVTPRRLTDEMKKEVDYGIVEDTRYLIEIHKILEGEEPELKVNNVDFLKSINVYIEECPEMLTIEKIEQYIKEVVIENQEFKDNEELQRLNNELINLFIQLETDAKNLNTQLTVQSIFSLLFSDDIRLAIEEIKESPDKDAFFDEKILSMVTTIIKKNSELHMFDEFRIENARHLLFAFSEEGILSREELNEMKMLLNVTIDEEYKKKNREFYLKVFSLYNNCNYRYVVEDFSKFKKTVNTLISSTPTVISMLIEPSVSVEEIAYDEWASLYMNYVINRFQIITKDPLMVERIKDVLYYNEIYLTGEIEQEEQEEQQQEEADPFFVMNNMKMQKKIKRLQK